MSRSATSATGRNPAQRVSLKTIAEQLNLSVATVSRVVNKKPGISQAVRDQVTKALEAHGYQPRTSRSARARQETIAFVVSRDLFHQMNEGRHDLYERHLFAIQRAITNAGFYSLLLPDDEGDDNSGLFRWIKDKRIKAVVTESWDFRSLEAKVAGLPLVCFNRLSDQSDSVIPNIRAATQAQLSMLHELGHRSIAMFRSALGRCSHQDTEFWLQYLAFMRQLNGTLPVPLLEPERIERGKEGESALAFCRKAIAQGVTAILTYDGYAFYLIEALKSLGVKVPEEMSVVGFNDSKLSAELEVPLTTYRQDFETMGQEAIRLLMDRMEHPELPPRQVQITGKLIIRASAVVAKL